MIAAINILVVDDDAAIRGFVTTLLTKEGYRVVAVESGEAALEAIATQAFNLALIDLEMPGIDGMEVLAALHQRSPDTATIILTAHSSIDSATEALRQGAHDYLLKPCKSDALRKSVRAGLEKHWRALQQRSRINFASDVSHELRAPLTNIHLYLELLERGKPEKRTHYLNNLKQTTDQMTGLIEDILTLSRLEVDSVEVEVAPEDLNVLVAQVVAVLRMQAQATGLELTFEPDAALSPVRVKRRQLVQVITNLVTNAINYTPAGQVLVSTHLDAERKLACLQIRDTGIGIASEDLPHLFQRFYRGRGAAPSNTSGNGLGLAIVKEIVDLHGGEIEVESQVGEGSRFRVWLPLE